MRKKTITAGAVLVMFGLAGWTVKANSSRLRSTYNSLVSLGYKQTIVTSNLVVEAMPEAPAAEEGAATSMTSAAKLPPKMVVLAVPYVPEAPDGKWTGSWKNACEEASVTMVDKFYAGAHEINAAEAKSMMEDLFKAEVELWGSDANSDVAKTVELINSQTSTTARIAEDPTVEQIKTELILGRPVIVPLNGKTLDNVNIPFLRTGSYYHMLAIIGYDDAAQEFITNDDGDLKTGQGHRYAYGLIMRAMHDYVAATKTTDGPMRAIFTARKGL